MDKAKGSPADGHRASRLPEFDQRLRRASILLYGLATVVSLVVVNVPQLGQGEHRAEVNAMSVLGIASLLAVWRFPWHRYHRNLFLTMSVTAALITALLVYLTGGAASPFDAYWFLIVFFASLYYQRKLAMLVAVGVTLLTLLPVLYDDPSLSLVVRHVVMGAGYITIILIGNILPVELLEREQARMDLEADLRQHRRLRDELARSNQLERRRRQQLEAIHDIGRSVASILDPQALYEELVRAVRERLGYSTVAMLVPDASQEELVLVAAAGMRISPESLAEGRVRIRMSEGIVGHVARTRGSYYTGDVRSDPYYKDLGDGADIRSELAVPILAGEALLGILKMESSNPNEFDDTDVVALEAVADQAAVSLRNAHAHALVALQARTDSLTGVLNHRALIGRLEQELSRARRSEQCLSVLFLDVDHFKEINDSYGHDAGDAVLREVSRLVKGTLRAEDTVGRYGGEEFVILLPGAERQESLGIAERIRATIAAHSFTGTGGASVGMTVSLGVATYPDAGGTQADLLRSADRALYQAKRLGRNRVSVAPEHPADAVEDAYAYSFEV